MATNALFTVVCNHLKPTQILPIARAGRPAALVSEAKAFGTSLRVMLESVWSRERSLSVKSWSFTVVAVGTGAVGSYYAYSFVKRFNLSTLLRNVPKKALKDLEPGEYVRVEGIVTTTPPSKGGAGPPVAKTVGKATEASSHLVSLKAHVPCVVYQVTEYRVMEEMTSTTASIGKGRTSRGGKSGSALDSTDGRIVHSKDKWTKKQEVMKDVRRTVPAYLVEGDSPSFVHIDLSGDPLFFELQVVHDEFRDAERQVETRSSRRTLGYREVEQVLPLHTPLLVFGEVSRKSGTGEAGEEELVVKRPATLHMFDRKTARKKPFVITTMNETELLSKVEGLARIDLYISGACLLVAVVTGGFAYFAGCELRNLRQVGAPPRLN